MTYVMCHGCGWEQPTHAPYCVTGKIQAYRARRLGRIANLERLCYGRMIAARFQHLTRQRRMAEALARAEQLALISPSKRP